MTERRIEFALAVVVVVWALACSGCILPRMARGPWIYRGETQSQYQVRAELWRQTDALERLEQE